MWHLIKSGIVLGLYLSLLGCPAEEGPGPNEPQPTKPTATNDAGLTETLPPPITDAGINNPPMPADAGGTIPAPAIDAGNTVLEPASDAGNTIPTGTIDSGNLNEGPPSDAGTLTPSEPTDAGHGAATDGGTSVIPLPSTNDIYRGLYPHCYQCHSGGARNYFSELEDDSNFIEMIARDPFFVLPGVPQASELYLLLLGQGDTIGAPQMPPYGDSFATLSANGDTDISIQDVYDWILFMDDIEITDGGFLFDGGPQDSVLDAGAHHTPDSGITGWDSGYPITTASISIDFSDVLLLTDPENDEPDNESVDIEADGIMSHEVRVTVRSSENLPIANAEVRIVNFLNNMTVENCSGSAPGVTDAQGMIICRLTSQLPNEFIFDVQAKSAEEEGWVLLYDNLRATFSPCQNARTFFIREIMGPVFTTCIGCHNEYGLAREWPWSHDPQTTPNLSWPWQGKIEGETGFIETNLAQLSELVDSYGTTGVFSAPGYDEGIPYILAKPAGLIAPTNADDPSLPYGHGGGKILEPGSDDFNKFLELLHRVDDDKECPTDSESLFHDPYAGASEYTAAELYHRASFTLTGQFPSPEEYQELIDNDVFDETDYLDKLSTDQNDTANILTANTNADRDLSTGNTTDSDTNTTNSILYQDAFYERLGEALEDLLLIREGGAGDVDALFALDNLAYQRRMTFRQKYDADLSSAPSFACLPEQDFEYDSTCNPNQPGLPSFYDGEGLSDEDCMIKRGCCEEIANSTAWNDHIPPLDPDTNSGPQCGQYANVTDALEDTCNAAAGCYVKKTHESFADLNYDIYAPDGSFIDRNDSQAVLTLQWVPQDGQDKDYGYCYTIRENNQDKQRCWHDSDMSWADTRGFRSGGAESDILIPNAPFFLQYPKRVIITNSGQYKSEVYTDSNKYKLIMPWDCRHDFCANGYEWGNKDLGKQTNKLMEQILRYPGDPDLNGDFRKVLTSDQHVLNPYVAFIYGQNPNDGTFEDPMDREEWQKIEDMKAVGNMIEQLDVRFYSVEAGDDPTDTNKTLERPTVSGWLTMPTFLSRYPTTPTNLNRMRSNEVHKKFLAVDIMSLVSFTVDPNQPLPENATLQGFSCRVCHAAMDPLGAHFRNYTRNPSTYYDSYHTSIGRIMDDRPDTEEYECENKREEEECVRTAGYKGSLLAEASLHEALPALGEQIVNDDRFSLAIVRWLHESLLGLAPLKPPKDRYHPYYAEMVDAYIARHHEMERVRTIFVESGYNLRAAITAILNGRIYRIKKAKFSNEYQKRVYDFAGVGAGQRLIPEQLNRKIFDTLGYPWLQVKANGTYDRRIALLNARNWYQLMYGGIDNREVVKRDRNPSPISAAIARRMAVQMACLTVPQEFSYTDPEERRLFRFVDLETTVESDELAIQKQVQWLFLALYGEHLHLTHTEIAHAVAFFDDIQSEFSNYDTCFNDVAGLLTEYFEYKADLEACLLDRGYAGNYIGAPIETVNLCLASLDDTYTTTSSEPTPYNAALVFLMTTILEDNGYEVPELLDENSFALTISAALTTQCGQYNSEGKALPTKCNATKDFYTGEALSALENRRNIRALEDLNYTVRAWQVVLTAMLSDYKYLYE